MRFIVGVLACSGILSVAVADPSSPASAAQRPSAQSTAPADAAGKPAPAPLLSAGTPATPSPAAKSPAEFDQLEKQLLSEGYGVETRGGQKVFCRREQTLGSRLPGPKVCETAARLKAAEAEAKDATEHVQKWAPVAAGGH